MLSCILPSSAPFIFPFQSDYAQPGAISIILRPLVRLSFASSTPDTSKNTPRTSSQPAKGLRIRTDVARATAQIVSRTPAKRRRTAIRSPHTVSCRGIPQLAGVSAGEGGLRQVSSDRRSVDDGEHQGAQHQDEGQNAGKDHDRKPFLLP
jgi:hypothetical protein